MLELKFTAKFKKDYKHVKRQGRTSRSLSGPLRRLCGKRLFLMRCATIRSAGHIAVIASVKSSLTGCLSIVWTRKGLFSLPRAQGVIASCWGCRVI